MRSHCSVYIDAGYLLASAATRATGTSLRKGIHVDFRALAESIGKQAEAVTGLPLLRMYWYDAAKNGIPDTQQERIGELPKLKLRLGRFGVDGQQKGVDLRIGLDLVSHAHNQASDAFVLVSGDDDLTEAVEEAQAHGVQVVVLAVPNADNRPHAVSRHLIRAADELVVIDPDKLDGSVIGVEQPELEPAPTPAGIPTPRPTPAAPSPLDLAGTKKPVPAPPSSVLAYSGQSGGTSQIAPGYRSADEYDAQIDSVVANVLASFHRSATPAQQREMVNGRPSIPRELDRALLLDLCDDLGIYDLSDEIRFRLRDRFWVAVDQTN